ALLVQEGDEVLENALLAVLENPAQWKDVLHLDSIMTIITPNTHTLPENLNLGTLQTLYSTLYQHWREHRYHSIHENTSKRINHLQRQIAQLRLINGNLDKQKNIFADELSLITKTFQRQKRLYTDGIISEQEFEKSESDWLRQKRQLEAVEIGILQNQMQIRQIESQINDLRITKSETQLERELLLIEDIKRMQSAVAEWKQSHLVTAPISGTVSFSTIRSEKQNFNPGDEILGIVPANSNKDYDNAIIGWANLDGINMGKIRPGNKALIELAAFPAQQFGLLEGKVDYISSLPNTDNQYQVRISLSKGLESSSGTSLPFHQEMMGYLRIISEDRRLIERLLDI
ncbi:MAG: HlyD family secretion protein, partial [Thermoanaerobaculia bacterium]|nr:HlyD family secretion protein [Thermoanaerobaculia bacterium]